MHHTDPIINQGPPSSSLTTLTINITKRNRHTASKLTINKKETNTASKLTIGMKKGQQGQAWFRD